MTADFHAHPLLGKERINSLDLLRGFALLGILLMNIQVFAMPGSAYMNPSTYGDLQGINYWVWAITHVLVDQKFISLFSILFGAGVCVFTERAEHSSGGALGLHYRRMFWLLLFGLIHAHFIWYGDILVSYALCGFLVFWFRRLSVRALLIWSAVFFLIPVLYNGLTQLAMSEIPEQAKAGMLQSWAPSADKIQAEINAYTGSWVEQQAQRHKSALMLETLALYRMGALSGECSASFYNRLIVIGAIVGLGLSSWGVQWNFEHQWSLEHSMFGGSLFNYIGSIALTLAYLGPLMRAYQLGWITALQQRLMAVGRMAFSNYIAQSILCTFVFYGFGLGLFGSFERWQQLLVVLGVWLILLIWSPIWLKRYQFGPLEWLWRALSYWQMPPLRRSS